MYFAGDIVTIFFGVATLLLLSLYTLARSREQMASRPATYAAFLYDAVARRYCLAGTLGYAFSITYYGATTIYGHLYGPWVLLMLAVVAPIAVMLVRRVIHVAHDIRAQNSHERPSNLLLDLLRARLGAQNAEHVLTIYIVIYFSLLVEELAVSRVMLATMFPGHPFITAILLATIISVILAYLKWGGFRAILIADFEQIKILFPFVLAIVFLIYRTPEARPIHDALLSPRANSGPLAFVLGVCAGVTWISASVDLYSRLNFRTRPGVSERDQQKAFATLAIILTTAIFAVAAIYGMCLPDGFSAVRTPVEFTRMGVQFAVAGGSRTVSIIFFASVFCMIFTTVNSLAFTLFQLGFYRRTSRPHVREIHKIILWAVVASCAVWPNAISAYGLFVGALMLLPTIAIIAAISGHARRSLPSGMKFLWPALALSVLAFVVVYQALETNYLRHYWLPAIVGASVMIAGLGARMAERGVRRGSVHGH